MILTLIDDFERFGNSVEEVIANMEIAREPELKVVSEDVTELLQNFIIKL